MVQPARLLSPRYADSTSATIAATSPGPAARTATCCAMLPPSTRTGPTGARLRRRSAEVRKGTFYYGKR
ncbi:hypothetical protein CS0771_29830 [Catellatospora sp. IY07-71]|nr:hypothetical protein CS0771_29830 [Catellatospora sp. IY07-71]